MTARLQDVLEDIGPVGLQLLAGAGWLDRPAEGVHIFDPTDPAGAAQADESDIVLGVGVGPGHEALVGELASAGASALVVRAVPAAPTRLIAAADAAGLCLLATPVQMQWGQLHSLIRGSLASHGAGTAGQVSGVVVGDVFELANAIAAALGGHVLIEDPSSQVVAYSSGTDFIDEPRRDSILGRRVPETWRQRAYDWGVARRLLQSDEPVLFTDEHGVGMRTRLAVAVRAGGEPLGSIWVNEGDRPFDTHAVTVLKEAARLAAVYLIRHRGYDQLQRRHREDIFGAYLVGQVPARALLGPLNLRPEAGLAVAAIHCARESEDGDTLAARTARITELVHLHVDAYRRDICVAGVGQVVYLLCAHAATRRASIGQFLIKLLDTADLAGERAPVLALGLTVRTIDGLDRSRRAADDALRAAGQLQLAHRLLDAEELEHELLLSNAYDWLAAHHRPTAPIRTLISHDATKGSQLVDTLTAVLDAGGDLRAAAARCHIHVNSLRYRLRRIGELTRTDLDDPVTRLALHLQLGWLRGHDRVTRAALLSDSDNNYRFSPFRQT